MTGCVNEGVDMRQIAGIAGFVLLTACAVDPAPLASSAPAPTTATRSAGTAAPAAATPASERKICRNMPVTGSLASKRVCSTKAEWAAFDKKGQEGVDAYNEARRQYGN